MSSWGSLIYLHSLSTWLTSGDSLVGTVPWGLSPWRVWWFPWQESQNTHRGPGSSVRTMTAHAQQVKTLPSLYPFCKWVKPALVGKCKLFYAGIYSVWTFYVGAFFLGFHHIRVHTPGATESATVGNNLSCTMCSSLLKEDVKFRVLGGKLGVYILSKLQWNVKQKENSSTDKQLVELVHVKALDALKGQMQSALRYQSVTLFLRGRSSYGFNIQSLTLLSKLTICPKLH